MFQIIVSGVLTLHFCCKASYTKKKIGLMSALDGEFSGSINVVMWEHSQSQFTSHSATEGRN